MKSRVACRRAAAMAAVAVLGFASAFGGGSWYVAKEDPNASDVPVEGRGSEALPFRTIQAALDNEAFKSGDTVYVKRGVYDEGGAVDSINGMTNRVYITKKVHLKAVEGRAVTAILGRHADEPTDTAGLGIGPGAIRCICVAGASGTVIEGFTLKDGATSHADGATPNYNKGGGLLVYDNDRNVYLVDSACVNCVGRNGGAMRGGTAIRCLFDRCGAQTNGGCIDYGCAFACVMTRTVYGYPIGSSGNTYAVNCTVVCNNSGGIGSNSKSFAYNCVFAGNSGTEAGKNSTKEDSIDTSGAQEGKYMVFSPASEDYRLVKGGSAIGLGRTANFAVLTDLGVPADYLKYDFLGSPIDTDAETVNAGAVQAVAGDPVCARMEFTVDFALDGRGCFSNEWVNSEIYPVQYLVKPVVPADKVFYHFTATEGEPVYLQPDGKVRLMPPHLSLTATQLYTAWYAGEVLWTDPAAAAGGTGTSDAPFACIQDAIDSVKTDRTVIFARKGDYKTGSTVISNIANRVSFLGQDDRYVLLKSVDGPEATTIWGAADDSSTDADTPGCGENAVRCVFGSRKGAIQGFTLRDGHTYAHSADGLGGGSDFRKNGGAVYSFYKGLWTRFQMLDCVITNCAGANSILFNGANIRCKVVGCSAVGAVQNRGILSMSLVTGNAIGNYPNNRAVLNHCTFSGNTRHSAATAFVAWYATDGVYDCVMVDPISAIRSKTDHLTAFGNWVWGNTGGASEIGECSVHADPMLADADAGDYRLLSGSPAIGGGSWVTNSLSCYTWEDYYWYSGSDIRYGPMSFAADGSATPGCFQTGFPTAVDLDDAEGLLLVNGGTPRRRYLVEEGGSVSLTFANDPDAPRRAAGISVDGKVYPFPSYPGSLTLDIPSGASSVSVKAILSTDWYVDAEHGDDGNKGFTPATAKKTLAEVFTGCAVRAGDTVNALPGAYAAGTMRPTETAAVLARAVVPEGVNLRSTDGAGATFIVGAASPEPTDGYGCGTNAVRGLYLMDRASVDGFTITGGRALGTEGVANIDYYGGGVRGRDGYDNAGADLDMIPIVSNCIISNNAAGRAAGCFYARFVKCRIFENVATGDNMSGGGYAAFHQCVVDRNRGGVALMYPWLVNGCTLGPNNVAADGKRANDLYFFGEATSVKVWNSLVFKARNDSGYYRNCAFADDQDGMVTADHIGEGSILTNSAALALDTEGRPCFGNAVIDKGADSCRDAYFPETDCGGVPRILNGGRFDIGALEYDWRVRYSRDLGGKVVVTDVTSNVVENADGTVGVPEGFLKLDWVSTGSPHSFKAQVAGEGTLRILVNGEVFATTTSADGPAFFRLPEPLAENRLEFAFAGDGQASLSDFRREIGLLLIVK